MIVYAGALILTHTQLTDAHMQRCTLEPLYTYTQTHAREQKDIGTTGVPRGCKQIT